MQVEDHADVDLSSGEEEEVRWAVGGTLDTPIVPPLPECVLKRAAAATLVLDAEPVGNNPLYILNCSTNSTYSTLLV